MACGGLFVPSTQASHTQCLLDIAVFFVGNDDTCLLKLCDLTHLPKQEELACEGHPNYTHIQIEHGAYNCTNNAQYDSVHSDILDHMMSSFRCWASNLARFKCSLRAFETIFAFNNGEEFRADSHIISYPEYLRQNMISLGHVSRRVTLNP